jgi:hypothetical protein
MVLIAHPVAVMIASLTTAAGNVDQRWGAIDDEANSGIEGMPRPQGRRGGSCGNRREPARIVPLDDSKAGAGCSLSKIAGSAESHLGWAESPRGSVLLGRASRERKWTLGW